MNYTCPECHKTSQIRFATVPRNGKLPTVMVVDHEDDCPLSVCPPVFIQSADIDRRRLERLAVDIEEIRDIIDRMEQIIARHVDGDIRIQMTKDVLGLDKAATRLSLTIKDGMNRWFEEADAYNDKHAREV